VIGESKLLHQLSSKMGESELTFCAS
jgi:hypothetical protein